MEKLYENSADLDSQKPWKAGEAKIHRREELSKFSQADP